MEKKRIYLSSPTMHGEEQAFINEAFATNWVAPLGPNVNALEQEMTAYMGGGHACALSAGTAAIHLALRILGIGQGDVVFAPSLTLMQPVIRLYMKREHRYLLIPKRTPGTWIRRHSARHLKSIRMPKP